MQFEFTTASRIIFGAGKINSIGQLASEFGNRAFIACGTPKDSLDKLTKILDSAGIAYVSIKITGEPTIETIASTLELVKQYMPDVLIGIGGGSALDTAKATSALITNPGDVTDYLEIIGQNLPLTIPALPNIAIPTTAGTGSEATKNAVLGSAEHQVKVSLRSPYLLPRIALVDPELTKCVPPSVTAMTGLDALTQLIEPFTCNNPNPLTDALCQEGMRLISHSLQKAYDDGNDLPAREDMSLAALFSGICLANARLGAVHGLAGSIGGEITAPHGAICASLLPIVMEKNLAALHDRDSGHPVLYRYDVIGKLLCGDPSATAECAIQWVRNYCTFAKIPPLSTFGLSAIQFPQIIKKSLNSSSMKGNPITLTEVELRNILQESL